jgi:hypothetical protein
VTPANPLVAAPVEMSTPLSGTFLLEDGEALVQAIESGDWVSGGMAVFAAALDTAAAVSDPLGSLIAAGLGWVMEHIEPLKGWLNDLTGDAGEVAGFAATWTNVANQLRESSSDLSNVLADVESMDGVAIQAYLAFQTDTIKHLDAAGSWADGMASGLQVASTIVKIVHDVVRDAIATVVGAIISYAAELVVTVGLATPLVIEQVSTRVASLVGKVGKSITRLLESGKALESLLKSLEELFEKAAKTFDKALTKSSVADEAAEALKKKKSAFNDDGTLKGGNGRVTLDDGIVHLDGVPTMTHEMFDHILDTSVHKPEAPDVMLGKYLNGAPGNYIERALENGSSYFSLGPEWDTIKEAFKINDADMFDLFNRPFLNDAYLEGKTVHFSQDPKVDVKSLRDEYEFLVGGPHPKYLYDDVTWTAIPIR